MPCITQQGIVERQETAGKLSRPNGRGASRHHGFDPSFISHNQARVLIGLEVSGVTRRWRPWPPPRQTLLTPLRRLTRLIGAESFRRGERPWHDVTRQCESRVG